MERGLNNPPVDGRAARTDAFVWPPPRRAGEQNAEQMAPGDTRGAAQRPRAGLTRNASKLKDWLWEIERAWIGVEAAPLERRLQDAGVVADAGDVYCWRCAHAIGPMESNASGCARCRGERLSWDEAVRLGPYGGEQGALWRRCVLEVKFRRFGALGLALGERLGERIGQRLNDQGLDPAQAVIVPVPTSFWRRMSRGIDHPRWIARGVARATGGVVWPCLARSHRAPQSSLPRSQRFQSVRGTIGPTWASRLAMSDACGKLGRGWVVPASVQSRMRGGGPVVLVDDVTTTGATAMVASRALRAVCKPLFARELRVILGVVAATDLMRDGR